MSLFINDRFNNDNQQFTQLQNFTNVANRSMQMLFKQQQLNEGLYSNQQYQDEYEKFNDQYPIMENNRPESDFQVTKHNPYMRTSLRGINNLSREERLLTPQQDIQSINYNKYFKERNVANPRAILTSENFTGSESEVPANPKLIRKAQHDTFYNQNKAKQLTLNQVEPTYNIYTAGKVQSKKQNKQVSENVLQSDRIFIDHVAKEKISHKINQHHEYTPQQHNQFSLQDHNKAIIPSQSKSKIQTNEHNIGLTLVQENDKQQIQRPQKFYRIRNDDIVSRTHNNIELNEIKQVLTDRPQKLQSKNENAFLTEYMLLEKDQQIKQIAKANQKLQQIQIITEDNTLQKYNDTQPKSVKKTDKQSKIYESKSNNHYDSVKENKAYEQKIEKLVQNFQQQRKNPVKIHQYLGLDQVYNNINTIEQYKLVKSQKIFDINKKTDISNEIKKSIPIINKSSRTSQILKDQIRNNDLVILDQPQLISHQQQTIRTDLFSDKDSSKRSNLLVQEKYRLHKENNKIQTPLHNQQYDNILPFVVQNHTVESIGYNKLPDNKQLSFRNEKSYRQETNSNGNSNQYQLGQQTVQQIQQKSDTKKERQNSVVFFNPQTTNNDVRHQLTRGILQQNLKSTEISIQ